MVHYCAMIWDLWPLSVVDLIQSEFSLTQLRVRLNKKSCVAKHVQQCNNAREIEMCIYTLCINNNLNKILYMYFGSQMKDFEKKTWTEGRSFKAIYCSQSSSGVLRSREPEGGYCRKWQLEKCWTTLAYTHESSASLSLQKPAKSIYYCQPQIYNSLLTRAGPEGPNGLREQHFRPTSKPIGLAICIKDIEKKMKWPPTTQLEHDKIELDVGCRIGLL